MNEVGEGQNEEQQNNQHEGEECQGGAYGVSLGTYGGPVASVSQRESSKSESEDLQDMIRQAGQWISLGKAGKPLRKATGNDKCKHTKCN